MTTLHRRMRLTALADALGIDPPPRLVHDEHLMQYASGTLSRRDWPAL